jgi:tetratricopeptide (TPR) repeat protein
METTVAPAPGKRELWAALGLCLLTLLVYSNSFHTGFPLDNGFILQQDRFHAATLHNAGLILRHTYWWPVTESGLYRPLTSLSYLFNYAVLGNADHPAGYHAINVMLQAGNVVLAYFVALRLIGRFTPAFFAAAIWAVHPLLTESVTNIVGRADLLSGMAVLSGFLMYLKSAESQRAVKLLWLGGLMAVTAAGLFAKESSVAIIGLIVLYEFAWRKTRGKPQHLIDGLLATLPPLAVFLYQRSAVLAATRPAFFAFADNPLMGAGFWTARLTAVRVMAKYLGLIVWPARLSSDYSYAQIPLVSGSLGDWAAWLLIAAMLACLIWLCRFSPAAFFFGSFALVTFLPGSNLLFRIGTIMAERLVYLPSFGVIACLVLGICFLGRRLDAPKLAAAVLCLAMLPLAVRTWVRNRDWTDDLTLAQSAVRVSPRSFKAHLLLAEALLRSGNTDAALTEAARSTDLLDSLPDSRNAWPAYRQSANICLIKGDQLRSADPAGSKREYRNAVRLLMRSISILKAQPVPAAPAGGMQGAVLEHASGECYRALSEADLKLNDVPAAYNAAVRSRDLDPSAPAAFRAVAAALNAAGRGDEAVAALIEGRLLTGDPGLTEDTAALSRERPDVVRKSLCTASADAVRLLIRTNRPNLAQISANKAVRDFGCDPRPLEEALAAIR